MLAYSLFNFCLMSLPIVLLVYIHWRQIRRFWKNLNVPHTTPKFFLGDFQNGGFSKNIGVLFKELYETFPNERFFGIWLFFKPILLIRDPDLIKTIFVKDFNIFHDRGVYYNEKDDPLSAHLFAIEGIKWKNIRAKLVPTFSVSKMKMMFPLMVDCSQDLIEYLKKPAKQGEIVEVKEVMARFMTDVIALCAFGIETKCLKNPTVLFRKIGKKMVAPNFRNFFVFITQFCLRRFAEIIRLRVLHKDVANFFMDVVKEVMDYREKNQIKRNDFMQLLIELKNKGTLDEYENVIPENTKLGEKLTFEEAAAQAFVFFLAGFETTSATVQFALFELAANPQIQTKLRKEILLVLKKHQSCLTYDAVHDLPYLDQVINETLRKYPVVPSLQRECNQNYRIPNSDVVIPKGTLIHIPIYGLHMDSKHFPDPEKFDPERFSHGEKQNRHNYTYLPFGEGPRNCIGKRFGLMQVRVALVSLLQNFEFEIPKGLDTHFTFDPKAFVLLTKGGLNLKINTLENQKEITSENHVKNYFP